MCFHIKFSFHLCIVALIFYCVSFVLKFNVLYLQALPHVARLFKPAVACPTCNYANDHTFKFCQQCGYVRRIVPCTLKDSVSFDLLSIDNRLDQLQQQRLSSAYSKQKQSFKQEFESFLFSLPAISSMPSHWMYVVSWYLKILAPRPSPTKMVVNTWVNGVYNHVVVRGVLHTVQ